MSDESGPPLRNTQHATRSTRHERVSMRRHLAIGAAAVALALGLAACNGGKEGAGSTTTTPPTGKQAGAPGGAKGHHIVFVFKSVGQYSEACKKGADQANAELAASGGKVDYLAPDTPDNGKQIAIIEQQIANKVDAIIISPNDAAGIKPIIQKATDAGVKVYTWDSDAPDSARVFYVAGADDVQIGRDIGDALAKDLGGKGKVQIMSGGRAAANLNLHVQGVEEALKKNPGITLITPYVYNDEDQSKATDLAKAVFQKDPDVAGFACVNSQGPPGVGEAVEQLGKTGQVKVWGLSLPSLTAKYLKDGAISGVMLWDPSKLTYVTAILVNNDLNGQPPKDGEKVGDTPIKVKDGKFVTIPTLTFTKDNVDQYHF